MREHLSLEFLKILILNLSGIAISQILLSIVNSMPIFVVHRFLSTRIPKTKVNCDVNFIKYWNFWFGSLKSTKIFQRQLQNSPFWWPKNGHVKCISTQSAPLLATFKMNLTLLWWSLQMSTFVNSCVVISSSRVKKGHYLSVLFVKTPIILIYIYS